MQLKHHGTISVGVYCLVMAHSIHGTHKHAVSFSRTLEYAVFLGSIVVAVILVRSGVIVYAISITDAAGEAGSFLSGMLYTSFLTSAPAAVALVSLGAHVAVWKIALIGALGVVCGDLILFRFIRSRLAQDVVDTLVGVRVRKFGRILSRRPFSWIVPALGAVVLASPLPDELGLLMIGASKLSQYYFVSLVYTVNVIGIFLLVTTAQAF